MPSVHTSALELIGNTPLVALDRLHPGPGRILAKAEFLNPGGSVKDRAARRIIHDALRDGRLAADQAVVEMTSGNMGAGLALVCNVLGHRFTAVMSAGNSPERVRMLEALGAEVVLVPQVDGGPGQVTGADVKAAADEARRLARRRGAWYVDQFHNPGSVAAHEHGTGPEIWRDLEGRLDAFVAIVGSGGTFVGTSRYLKSRNPRIVCAAVEPEGCEPLAGRRVTRPRHLLQGTGYGVVPPHWERKLADAVLCVSDDEAVLYRKLLAEKEGLHVGFSAAANVCASVKLLESGRVPREGTVVTVLCDTGLKYSSI
ncbi:MAG TPA: cysteine synthase family protein [Thermoanaerobaculia bacterium]|nr:cysteine synthase family protein [Thermoanaerobaculia bacterium]